MRFFIRVRYPIFHTQYDVHDSTMRYQQYIVICDLRFEFIWRFAGQNDILYSFVF